MLRFVGNCLLFVFRLFFDTRQLTKDVFVWWAEYLATRSRTGWAVFGWIGLACLGIIYVLAMTIYYPINRILTGKWSLD